MSNAVKTKEISGCSWVSLIAASWLATVSTGLAQSPNAAPPSMTGTEMGFGIFQRNCTSCHGNPAVERAPTPAQLREYPPERIYAALTGGVMKTIGDTLSDEDRRRVSESLAGRPFGSTLNGSAEQMPNRCPSNADFKTAGSLDWNGWGAGLANTRYQPKDHALLDAEQVKHLKLKWVFGIPNATSSYSQPTVVGGRVFVGSDTGFIYSLDAASGCVYWSFQSKAGVRNAMTIGTIAGFPGVSHAVFYGDLKSNAYALDAQTGRLLWTQKTVEHYTDRVTAAPILHKGRLYVPISSWEEFAAASPDYPCCTSVGAVAALDANTGRQVWKTYVIPQRPMPTRKNSRGVQQWAPAGGSVWNTPTIDEKRNALYFGTGDATTYPAAATSDSVMALNLKTGRVLWSYQVTKNDSFLGGCWGEKRSENCPKRQGPDWDIPSSVMLGKLDGRDLLIVGTKPGDVLALDPGRRGALVWRSNVHGSIAGDGPATLTMDDLRNQSGVLWGGALSPDVAYFGLSGAGGLAAVRLNDGSVLWLNHLGTPAGTKASNAAATTAIPGVIFIGDSQGTLKAAATLDGSVLWQFDTKQTFDAVNKVATHGGSISSAGAVVAGGMVFVGSGYAVLGGSPGNALLAFGLD
jgi:polyvinyl alcohol dehydrogenase (cytochrome)